MKIIGKTNDGFILEASRDDVAAMEGLYSHQKRFEVGDLIDMEGLFSKCKSIDIAFNDIDRLRNSAENIIKATSWIEEFRNG
jgi:hypothetical protein